MMRFGKNPVYFREETLEARSNASFGGGGGGPVAFNLFSLFSGNSYQRLISRQFRVIQYESRKFKAIQGNSK